MTRVSVIARKMTVERKRAIAKENAAIIVSRRDIHIIDVVRTSSALGAERSTF